MKSILKTLLSSLFIFGLLGSFAGATTGSSYLAFLLLKPLKQVILMSPESLLDWKVGDALNFNMQLKPIPTVGTMSLKVTAATKDTYTMEEDVDVSALKQKIEVVIDKNTGEIKKMTMNGKDTAVPDGGTVHLVTEEAAHIKVPAGEFDCIHIVTEDGEHQRSQSWINPQALPISGLLKSKNEEGGVLEVNSELLSFTRGQ